MSPSIDPVTMKLLQLNSIGIKLALKVIETTEAFKELQPKYLDIIPEPCKSLPYRSDKYWKCFLKYKSEYWFHSSGTAKMGSSNDPGAVVDSKLRYAKCLKH